MAKSCFAYSLLLFALSYLLSVRVSGLVPVLRQSTFPRVSLSFSINVGRMFTDLRRDAQFTVRLEKSHRG